MRTLPVFLSIAGAAVLSAATASAQPAASPSATGRWAHWIGCWQVAEESVDDGARLLDDVSGSGSRINANSRARVCVAPAADGGVTMTTYAGEVAVSSETIVADGVERPLNDAECHGTQRAEWSTLGPRVFTRAAIACGDQSRRVVQGFSAMMAGPLWFDVQTIDSEGRTSVRVRRYRRASDQSGGPSLPAMRELASAPLGTRLTLAEIAEAATRAPAAALQAAILELGGGGYDLKSKQLRELQAAGVPGNVIDLMIAMSYPKQFVVERASGGGGGFGAMDIGDELWPFMAAWPHGGMWPYYGDASYAYLYGPYYSAAYLPFAYRYWGFFDPAYFRYGYGSGFVVIDPAPGGGSPPERSGAGRVVDGRGYTRIRRSEPDTATRVNNGDGSGASTASSGSNSGSTASSTSGASSGGYSSGGASGGDRVAVPRPPS
jgi:hypothetical protein